MAYLDPNIGVGIVDDAIGTWPAAAAPANGVSMPAALKWLDDAVQGANGVVTFPAAAAPANGVSLAEVIRAIYNLNAPVAATGEADIDISAADYTNWQNLIAIEPAAGAPLLHCRIVFDLDKATTGWAAVATTHTIQFAVSRKVDGTNYRRADNSSNVVPGTALAGDNADGDCVILDIGPVGVTEDVRIEVKVSAEPGADVEIPYSVYYTALAAPTITPVAA